MLVCSFSSLAYEIALTRIFSISLWYHFAFMVISIAMLGIGASGTALSLYPGLKKPSRIGIYCLLLGIAIAISYTIANRIPFDPVKLMWSRSHIFYVAGYYLILSVPFFFSGLVIATALSSFSSRSSLLYGADLLGAGMGCLGILGLLTFFSPDRVVFLLASAAFIAAFLNGGKYLKCISSLLVPACIVVFVVSPSFTEIRISPYKGLQQSLSHPGAEHLSTYLSPYSRIDVFRSPAARFAPGLSLRYLGTLPEQLGVSFDGGNITAITKYDNEASLEFLKYLPSSLPYAMKGHDSPGLAENERQGVSFTGKKVLILDSGGGLQALVAEYWGYKDVVNTESNALFAEIIRRDFDRFSGGILKEHIWTGLGRAWLKQDDRLFDIIDIPLTGTSPSGAFGISEDYRFTVEAFREYLSHLTRDGVLSISLFIIPPPRTELRLVNTAVRAMEELGQKDSNKHVAAIRSWGSICILIKNSVFSRADILKLKRFAEERRFDLVYYPGISEEETNIYVKMPDDSYSSAFMNLLDQDTRTKFARSYIFEVSPVYDDSPFFNYYLKLDKFREIYHAMGGKWQFFVEEGYILPVVFIQVLLLSFVLILLPVFSVKYRNGNTPTHPDKGRIEGFPDGVFFLPYFGLLGLGFMFIEISLIQKMILPLEYPPYAAATVLTSILISSGTGSLLSHNFPEMRRPSTLIAIPVIAVIYSLALPALSDSILPYPVIVKVFLVFLLLMPPGLLMGIPFPAGLHILGKRNEYLIPWAWAINGCLSVLAPILTILLAIEAGFKIVILTGALSYAAAFLMLRMFLKKTG